MESFPDAQRKSARDATVLLVEDEPAIAEFIEQLLGPAVFTIQTADTLYEAGRMVDRNLPDLIILDRMLPDGDGAEFCARLRSDERTRRIPVLFLTVRSSYDDRLLALKSGIDDFLAKPFQPEELLLRAEVLLRGFPVAEAA